MFGPGSFLTLGVFPAHHSTIFPLALGQIIREYAVTEMHLTLNAGNWKYDLWGSPPEQSVGTGAELRAWMTEDPSLMRWA